MSGVGTGLGRDTGHPRGTLGHSKTTTQPRESPPLTEPGSDSYLHFSRTPPVSRIQGWQQQHNFHYFGHPSEGDLLLQHSSATSTALPDAPLRGLASMPGL
eukprot:11925705-Alexandrium_andersonii.AAC.1